MLARVYQVCADHSVAVLDDFVDDACKFEPPLDHYVLDRSRLVGRPKRSKPTATAEIVREEIARQRLGSRWF